MRTFALAAFSALLATAAHSAEWTPAAWTAEDTLQIRTVAPGEGEHWSTLWLVVLDDQVYLRLGSRAAGRIERNQTAPIVGVKIAGREFGRVRAEPAPEAVPRVATAMGDKYWSDVVIKYFPHPLTVRLVPE